MPDVTAIPSDFTERLGPLTIDPRLLPAWRAVFPDGPDPRGLAGRVIETRAAVIVAVPDDPGSEELERLRSELATAFEVPSVELAVVPVDNLSSLMRAWLYQAAQGSGRGVRMQLESTADGGTGHGTGLRVLIRAIDSSARELAFRLASPHEPALGSLRALLGGLAVEVLDAETAAPAVG
ncbi:MAG: hypothetical protein QG608_977 [Actinomycetota bacterium]|nr:hypothetical protein [Actinomycetota bacterium]